MADPRKLRVTLLAVGVICGGGLIMSAVPGECAGPDPLVIVDLDAPDVLDLIGSNEGVSVSLTGEEGERALEVRVEPFSVHGNKWPYVFFNDRYFREPSDLSRHSRMTATVRNATEGLATVSIRLSSKPYNDGGRNLEGEGFVIPGGTTMECSLSTSLFRLPMNDPSSIQMLMFIFPANERNVVYRIEEIEAVYDPVEGSPTERLLADAEDLLRQIGALEQRVNWDALAADQAAALRQRIPELAASVARVLDVAETAETEGWRGTYNKNRDVVVATSRRLGEFVLADKTSFHLWGRSPYTYCYRDALPDFDSPTVDEIEVSMARNEFRDATFMVTACGETVDLEVRVDAERTDLTEAVQLRWSEFVTPPGGEEYADVLVPMDGPLSIPDGESRELWVTFDGRQHRLAAGRHALRLELHDRGSGLIRSVPVELTVWDFELPSYDLLPNNAYVEYHNSEIGAKVPAQGVRHMKMYGVNTVYVYPHELPWPVEVDEALNITTFDATTLVDRIKPIQQAWDAAPGEERLRWIFALTGAPERLVKDEGIAYPSEQWRSVLAQWLPRFRELMTSLGIADDDWMFVLADESSESVLVTYEIPFAEMIKQIDSRITLSCNASQVISDAAMAERFFRAFDVLQPSLESIKESPALRDWLRGSRGPVWTYRCQSMAGVDRNLYDYYRVYAWDMIEYGITGMGVWTYCAQGESPWGETKRGIGYNLVFKHRDRDEVVHSRRYEFYREGADDYRYVQALLVAAREQGEAAEAKAHELIRGATADIRADVGDVNRCEKWRERIASEILRLRGPG